MTYDDLLDQPKTRLQLEAESDDLHREVEQLRDRVKELEHEAKELRSFVDDLTRAIAALRNAQAAALTAIRGHIDTYGNPAVVFGLRWALDLLTTGREP